MNNLDDLIPPGGVLYNVAASNKLSLLKLLSAHAAALTGHDPGMVMELIAKRERLGTTGFGGGTAIPHARLTPLAGVVAVVAKLATPVDFEALDGEPVDIVVLMLAPAGAGADHLKALARVSRVLRDRDVVGKLRSSRSAEALLAILTADQQSRAA